MSNEENKFVETLAEDMARVIKEDKEGLVKKIIHEQELKEQEKKNLSPESKKNKIYMAAGIILISIAIGVLAYFMTVAPPSVPAQAEFNPIIFNDKTFFIETGNLNKEEITASILKEAESVNLKQGGLEGIYLIKDKKVVGLREFASLLKANFTPPGQELVSDFFLMGVISQAEKDFFILIKTRSFTDIFESMRAWEGKMLADLQGLFRVPLNSATSYLFTKNFEDGVIENKNARVLYDQSGNIALMYVYADDTSVVIARSREAVREIITRLSSSKMEK